MITTGGYTRSTAMEVAAANMSWTETENVVHSLGPLPMYPPTPQARPDHISLLRQYFQKNQIRWFPSLQVYRLNGKRGSNGEDLWDCSWVAAVAVSCKWTRIGAEHAF